MIRQIFKQSFKLIWQHPSLWFLGFLTTFLFLSTNEFFLTYLFSSFSFQLPLTAGPDFLKGPIKSISPMFLTIFLIIGVVLILISICSEMFLIFLVKKIKEGEEQPVSLRKSFKYLGGVLLLRLGEFLLFSFFLIILYFSLVHFSSLLASLLVLLLLLIIFFVLFIVRYSIFYFLLEKNNLLASLKNAFLFFRKYWFKTLEISFFLFLIIFLFGFISLSFIESGVFSYPLRVLNLVLSTLLGKYGFWFTAILALFFTIILQVVITGFIASYQLVCWLLFFLENRGNFVNKIRMEEDKKF